MRKVGMALATAAAIVAGASLTGSAQAAPVGLLDGARAAVDRFNIIEDAVCGTIRVTAGMAMAGMVPVGISVATPNVAVMVGAALTAGMDGVPT